MNSRHDNPGASTPRRTLLDEVTAHEATLERLKSVEDAYERFVPRQFLQLMGFEDIREVRLGDQVEQPMTILFADICDFTNLSESISPQENFNFLNSYLSQMQPAIAANGGVIDKYVGDAILALFPASADDALRGAVSILNQLDIYNAGRHRAGYVSIRIGIGVNTGTVMLGTVGSASRMDVTVIGDAVNLAARLERITREWDVSLLISEHTLLSLNDPAPFGIRFIDRPQVRGKQEIQSIYEVFDADPPALRAAKRKSRKLFETALACVHLGYPDDAAVMLQECLALAPEDRPARLYLERCHGIAQNAADILRPWSDDYLVGVEPVDADHRQLLAAANALIGKLLANRNDGVGAALAKLGDALDAHFVVEENLMEEAGYPLLLEHAREHRRLRLSYQQFAAKVAGGADDYRYLAFSCQCVVADWLIDHAQKSDRALGNFLKRTVARA
ncbi:MAG: adenylate/guanylate cyclase domain-containing protein [Rhodocyclaceae bacterium]|nr:adenylate/guanylate cyclase domain-containing protein [Rhodocyclaceae bacterium]